MRMRRLRADLQSTKEDLQRTMQTHTEFVVQSGRSVRSESVLLCTLCRGCPLGWCHSCISPWLPACSRARSCEMLEAELPGI
jgi:hypothetical protein